jgi:hypothetical protein
MPRLNINGGEVLDLPESAPVLITGWLMTNPSGATVDSVLSAVDADGDIFTGNGMILKKDDTYGGANLDILVSPTVVVTLTGVGSSASIYYERLTWSVSTLR